MKLFQRILSNLSFFFVVMLLFLLFFQNKISLPPAMQSIGRMHPLLLHLPVGLLILSFILWLFRKNIEDGAFKKIFTLVLHITAFTATLTALMGFFLSNEGGYNETILSKHKFLGVTTALLTYALLLLYPILAERKILTGSLLFLSVATLIVGGHFGSNLTHGENFVWSPLKGDKITEEEKITDSSFMFAAAVRPILNSKCFSCHNEKKAKGGLVMITEEKILEGGKNGPIWKSGDALNSHIIQNINLPEEEKKHMPPKGKPQLTAEEIQFLFAWIQAGADMKKRMKEYPETDSLKILAQKFIHQPKELITEKKYPFDAVSQSVIDKMNGPFCTVYSIALNSPALQADFYVREKFDLKTLEGLLKAKEQLVILNLGNMPVTDEHMKIISQFINLEKLNLNNSSVTNAGLEEIKKLKQLKSLSLAGTKIDEKAGTVFSQLDSLKEVFVWNSGISANDAAAIQKQNGKTIFNIGYIPDKSEILTLTAPSVKNEEFILNKNEKIELKHQLPGTEIRFTIDGSIPDSTSSAVYKSAIPVNGFTIIKTRAVKPGWYSSPISEFSFFAKGEKPTRAELINPPNEKYKGEGASTLTDAKKGTAENFNDPAWLGFREQPLIGLFYFDTVKNINSISVSYAKSVQSYLMPPAEVEIWGGEKKENLKLVKKIIPPKTKKEELNVVRAEGIKIDIPGSGYRVYKLVIRNVQKLPTWHPGKGEKGWIFIDEIFFN
jgi:uncharacterized membrane protein